MYTLVRRQSGRMRVEHVYPGRMIAHEIFHSDRVAQSLELHLQLQQADITREKIEEEYRLA